MNATKVLPENYHLAWEVNLDKNKGQMWLLQLLGLPWSLLVLAFLGWFTMLVRPEALASPYGEIPIATLVAMIPFFGFCILLHEFVHGLFFWYYTRQQPRFGFKVVYAYATAPGWYFPTAQYRVIGLAPLILLSILGLALIPVIPETLVYLLLFGIFTNASGAVGDAYIITRLAFEPKDTYVEDLGASFRVFRRSN